MTTAMTTKEKKPSVIKQKTQALNPKSIKEGDIVLVSYWAKVLGNQGGDKLWIQDLDDLSNKMVVEGKSLIETFPTADQFDNTVECTMTQLAEELIASKGVPFTVEFIKKEGDTRKLRGRFKRTEPLMGRSHVDDLDLAESYKERQVDHRSILSLIKNNTKFVLKKK